MKTELAMIGEQRKLFKLLRYRLQVMPVDDACAGVFLGEELRRYK